MANEKNIELTTPETGRVRKEATGKVVNNPPVTPPVVEEKLPPAAATNTTAPPPPPPPPPAVDKPATSSPLLNEDEAAIVSGESNQIAPEQSVSANPLSQPVIERAHNQPTYPGDTTTPMKEPVMQQSQVLPPSDTIPKEERTEKQKQEWEKSATYAKEKLGEAETGSAPANPAVALMSPKEKKDNLDMTVDTAIYYYSEGKLLLCSMFHFHDTKLMAMEAKNELRADWAVLKDSSTNEILTLRQFLQEANNQMMEAGKTSDEFKEKLRGPLRAELDRRGLIASPENNLMLLVGWDLFSTMKNLYTINSSIKDTIKRVKDEYADVKELGYISDRQLYNNSMNRKIPEQVVIREVVREAAPPAPTTNTAAPEKKEEVKEAQKTGETLMQSNDTTVFVPPGRKKKEEAV